MSKIKIDNELSLLSGYFLDDEFKKFKLSELKTCFYFINETNRIVLSEKYSNKEHFESLESIHIDMYGQEIEINKNNLVSQCFNYRMSDKNLFDIIKKTSYRFINEEKMELFYLFQELRIKSDKIIFIPTNKLISSLHCGKNHYTVDTNVMFKIKKVNTFLIYQFISSNEYIKKKYGRKFVFSIEYMKNYFNLKNMCTNDFIRKIILPSIQELNKIINKTWNVKTIFLGKSICSIEFF